MAEWYKKCGWDKIYAVDKEVDLESYEHSLQVRADDKFCGGTRDGRLGTEERRQQRQAAREAGQVRQIYEDMVLGKNKNNLVQLK